MPGKQVPAHRMTNNKPLGWMHVLLWWGLAVMTLSGCGDPSKENGATSSTTVPSPPSNNAKSETEAGDKSAHLSATDTPTSLTPVKILLNWFPEAEHGGFYAALEHGFYKDAGLDVKIIPGAPNVVIQQVASQQVDFGVVNADAIVYGRAQQAPVLALMAPLQISPRCIMVHEKSGIKSFDDIHDMTVAMSNTNAYSHYLRKKFPFKNVRVVPYPGNVTQFLQDEKFAQQGYVFSEPFVAREQGGDPHVLMVSDVGFNPYTSCLITSEKTRADRSDIVKKIVACSIRGWEQYLKAPQQTNALIHSLNKEMSPAILEFGVKELTPLVLDPVATQLGLGTMSEARWQQLVDQLIEIGQLETGKVNIAELYTEEYLEKAPPAKADTK